MRTRYAAILTFVSLFIWLHVTPALSADRGHRQAAEELLKVFDMSNAMTSIVGPILKSQQAAGMDISQYEDILNVFFAKHMNWDSMKEDVIDLYVAEFSEKELCELVAFYKSPVGRKITKRMPILAEKMTVICEKRFKENAAALNEMLTARAKELEQKAQAEGTAKSK